MEAGLFVYQRVKLVVQKSFWGASKKYTDLADLAEKLGTRRDIVIVDARREYAFAAEHIPGAINLPHRNITEATTIKLAKEKIYICYCDGIGCNASTRGSLKLASLGFKVRELIGGLEWWKKDGYGTEGEKPTAGLEIKCAC